MEDVVVSQQESCGTSRNSVCPSTVCDFWRRDATATLTCSCSEMCRQMMENLLLYSESALTGPHLKNHFCLQCWKKHRTFNNTIIITFTFMTHRIHLIVSIHQSLFFRNKSLSIVGFKEVTVKRWNITLISVHGELSHFTAIWL